MPQLRRSKVGTRIVCRCGSARLLGGDKVGGWLVSTEQLNRDQFAPASRSARRPWIVACSATVGVLAVSILLMWWLGLLHVPPSGNGTKNIAASLGLVGTVVAAAITLVGTLLKYSSDERVAANSEIQASRNFQLAKEEASRSRIDVALRAADLLGENNKDASEAQIAGAVLALVKLGELDLSVALLGDLWPKDLVSKHVVSQALQATFDHGSKHAKQDAACLLWENASLIAEGDLHIWPFDDLKWPHDFQYKTRLALLLAAIDWFASDLARRHFSSDAVIVLFWALDDPARNLADMAACALKPYAADATRPAFILEGGDLLSLDMINEHLTTFDSACPESARGGRIAQKVEALLATAAP